MSDLDEKLESAMSTVIGLCQDSRHQDEESWQETIKQVKQAFVDDGWAPFNGTIVLPVREPENPTISVSAVKPHGGHGWCPLAKYLEAGGDPEFVITNKNDWQGKMTGQAWYDRFIRELPPPFPLEAGDPQEAVDYYEVKRAAKKAANLE